MRTIRRWRFPVRRHTPVPHLAAATPHTRKTRAILTIASVLTILAACLYAPAAGNAASVRYTSTTTTVDMTGISTLTVRLVAGNVQLSAGAGQTITTTSAECFGGTFPGEPTSCPPSWWSLLVYTGDDGPKTLIVEAGDGTLPTMTVRAESLASGQTTPYALRVNAADYGNASTWLNVTGGDGNDTIIAGPSAGVLKGGAGDDTIDPGAGQDTIEGGPGRDTLSAQTRTTGTTIELGKVAAYGPDLDQNLDAFENAIGSVNADTIRATPEVADPTIDGGPGSDQIDGTAATGSAVLIGGTGNDTITGNQDDVVSYQTHPAAVTASLDGQANDGAPGETDTIQGPIRTLRGSANADTLTGQAGVPNRLEGLGGSDRFTAVEDGDTFDGGTGTDTVDYSDADHGVDASLHRTNAAPSGADGFTSIETLVGSDFDDWLRARPDGDSTVDGGAGNDHLYPSPIGQTTLRGGPGTDRLHLDEQPYPASVDLQQQRGSLDDPTTSNDPVLVLDGIEHVTGGPLNDRLVGDERANTLTGGPGDDTLDGRDGPDVLQGEAGSDTVTYENRTVAVTVNLEGGNSTPDGQSGEGDQVGDDIERVIGGSGDDTLIGNWRANTLLGGPGDDQLDTGTSEQTVLDHPEVFTGGPIADTYDGGTGTDTVSYANRTGALTITLDGQANDGQGGEGDQVLAEHIIGGSGKDTITGNGASNTLESRDGDDTINGQAGPDMLRGGKGADTLTGSAGQDTVEGDDGNDSLQLQDDEADAARCGAGADTVLADPADDVEQATCETRTNSAPTPDVLGGGATTIINQNVTSTGTEGTTTPSGPLPANNGTNADRLATLSALSDGVDYSLLRVARGKPISTTGRLLTAAGQPIAAAELGVYFRPTGQGDFEQIATTRTDTSGTYRYRGIAKLGGTLRVAYKANLADLTVTRTKDITLIVIPTITLTVNHTRIRNGQGVRFVGKVAGMPSWSKKIALLQVHVGGRWRTFGRDKHIDASGVMKATYRFTGTVCLKGRRCVVPYKFRFYVPEETGWPFAGRASRSVTVNVVGSRS